MRPWMCCNGTGFAPALILLVASLRHVDFFVNQRLLLQHRRLVWPLIPPRRDVGEMVVVAFGFAVFSLVLFPEMAAAGFVAMERVEAEPLSELHEVSHTTCIFQMLDQSAAIAGDVDVFREFLTQHRDPNQTLLHAGL